MFWFPLPWREPHSWQSLSYILQPVRDVLFVCVDFERISQWRREKRQQKLINGPRKTTKKKQFICDGKCSILHQVCIPSRFYGVLRNERDSALSRRSSILLCHSTEIFYCSRKRKEWIGKIHKFDTVDFLSSVHEYATNMKFNREKESKALTKALLKFITRLLTW